jgi:hypothetical protein
MKVGPKNLAPPPQKYLECAPLVPTKDKTLTIALNIVLAIGILNTELHVLLFKII